MVVTFNNTPDSGRFEKIVIVDMMRSDGRASRIVSHEGEIPDGGSVSWASVPEDQAGPANGYVTDMLPGTYDIWTTVGNGPRTKLAEPGFIPPGDPSGKGGPAASPGQPTAQVVKATGKKVAVRLDNRDVKSATTFQVTVKAKGRKAVKVVRTVPKGHTATVRVKVRKAVRVKVTAAGKVVTKTRL